MVKTKRFFCAALLMSICQPMTAAVLVLTDGEQIETRGPWQVRGRVVVFTTLDGKLSSLRIGGVDLAQSRRASEDPGGAAQRLAGLPQTAAPPAPLRRPVRVFTNADLPSSAPGSRRPGGRGEKPPSIPVPNTESGLTVDSWTEIEDKDARSLEILGTLSNRGSAIEHVVGIAVELREINGREGLKLDTTPDEWVLAPGSSTNFRAKFYNVSRDHGRPTFEIESVCGADNGSVNMAAALGR